MTLREQIDCWFQAGEHARTVQAILKLPGSECTDELMGELAVAYNNLGEYKKAILVLEELKNRVCFTASWQYRMGYALYHSAMKAPTPAKTESLLLKARHAFSAALQLNPKEHIRGDCLEFLHWICEDLKSLKTTS